MECAEGDARKVEAWLTKAMVDGMDQVLNALKLEGLRGPVEVKTGRAWGG